MKNTICLLAALIGFSPLTPDSASAKVYPEKNPVLTYATPKGWEAEIDGKSGNLSINSADGRISVNFAEVATEASMDVFEQMLPTMVKEFKEPVVTEKPNERTEDGLTGYNATYTAKVEDKPVMCMFVLFKGGKGHSVLANMIMENPQTLPEEDGDAFKKLMNSIKGVSKAGESFPEKNPVLTYATPDNWKGEVDKDGNLSINSDDDRISVNFAEVAAEASMATFETMLPAMVKVLKEPVEAEKPNEHAEDGLTGYTATYTGKIADKPAVCVFILFKGGKERAILGNVVMSDPQTMPEKDNEAFKKLMKSLKGIAK